MSGSLVNPPTPSHSALTSHLRGSRFGLNWRRALHRPSWTPTTHTHPLTCHKTARQASQTDPPTANGPSGNPLRTAREKKTFGRFRACVFTPRYWPSGGSPDLLPAPPRSERANGTAGQRSSAPKMIQMRRGLGAAGTHVRPLCRRPRSRRAEEGRSWRCCRLACFPYFCRRSSGGCSCGCDGQLLNVLVFRIVVSLPALFENFPVARLAG